MDDVATKLICPHCGRVGSSKKQIPPSAKIRCPACQQTFRPGETIPTPVLDTIASTESESCLANVASLTTRPAPATIAPSTPPQRVIQVGVLMEKRNPVATASLVLGIIAVLVCWVPFLGLLSIPVAALGILLGVVGFVLSVIGRRAGATPSGVGLALSIASVIVAMAITGSVSQTISKSLEKELVTSVPVTGDAAISGPKPNFAQKLAPIPPQGPEAEPGIPPPAPNKPQWAVFPDAARLDNIQVRVAKATCGKAQIKDKFAVPGTDGTGESKDDLLTVYIEIRNLDPNRKVDYSSFAGDYFDIGRAAALKDDLGNRYKRITFGFNRAPVGQIEKESIYPGKMISDVLIFELPVGNAKHLDLELPGSNLDTKGVFRLRIPVEDLNK